MMIGMADKNSCEDIGRQAWWWRCGTTGIDTAAEKMRNGNRRDVGQRRWKNGLEERQRTGQVLIGNDYQPEGVLLIQELRREGDNGPARRFGMNLETVCLVL